MTVSKRTAMIWWGGGLIAFAITIYLGMPLAIDAVPGGILDHQAAPDAAAVNAIQNAWQDDGLIDTARTAMISDLIFIGIFGIGCVLAGLYYRGRDGFLRLSGWIALISGIVFLVTDYGETISQFIQVTRMQGDDQLANIASTLQPIKIFSWIVAFLAVLIALVADSFSSREA